LSHFSCTGRKFVTNVCTNHFLFVDNKILNIFNKGHSSSQHGDVGFYATLALNFGWV